MKKLIIILTSILASFASLNAKANPELLKDRADFANYKKFESPTIYTNMQENSQLVAAYEADSASYKDEELFPVIMAYMSLRNIEKGEELLLKHIKVAPNNVAALRNLASVNMIKGNNAEGIAYYQKAADLGDVLGLKSLASAYIITKQAGEIKNLVPQLQTLAKTDLEAANILVIYAISEGVQDIAFAEKIIADIDINEALKAPTMDALNSCFNIYLNNKELFKGEAALIPARVAILKNAWVIATEAIDVVLAAKPTNTLAIKSKAVIEYRTGDVAAAFKCIEKAVSLGDAAAYNDFIELAIDSGRISKIEDNLDVLGKQNLSTKSNFILIRYGLSHNNPNIFFLGAMGKNSDVLFNIEQNKLIISEGLKKFSADARTKAVQEKLK